jgi:hypothetical protein
MIQHCTCKSFHSRSFHSRPCRRRFAGPRRASQAKRDFGHGERRARSATGAGSSDTCAMDPVSGSCTTMPSATARVRGPPGCGPRHGGAAKVPKNAACKRVVLSDERPATSLHPRSMTDRRSAPRPVRARTLTTNGGGGISALAPAPRSGKAPQSIGPESGTRFRENSDAQSKGESGSSDSIGASAALGVHHCRSVRLAASPTEARTSEHRANARRSTAPASGGRDDHTALRPSWRSVIAYDRSNAMVSHDRRRAMVSDNGGLPMIANHHG